MCRTFDKDFGLFFAATSELDQNIQYHENRTHLFCLSIFAYLEMFVVALDNPTQSGGVNLYGGLQ